MNIIAHFSKILFAVTAFSVGLQAFPSAATPYVIDPESVITRVPKSFLGLSIEYFDLANFIQNPKGEPNYIFVQMLHNLTPNGNGAPLLRIGGSSTDSSWYNPKGQATKPAGITFDITKKLAESIRSIHLLTASKFILGLNMAQDNPNIAIDWANAAFDIITKDDIIGFEIGNEPDLYGIAVYPGGQFLNGSNQPIARPTSWSFNDFLTDFNTFSSALNDALPRAHLIGQVYANYVSTPPAPFFLGSQATFLQNQGLRVRALSQHIYPLNGCTGTPSVADLLAATSSDDVAQVIATYANQGKPFYISELNSATCGGVSGVSNAFASALWGADILFELLQAGVRGVQVTTSSTELFTPFKIVTTGNKQHLTVNPLYYGMLLFAEGTAHNGKLVTVTPPGGFDPNLKIWATVDHKMVLRVVVINKNIGTAGSAVTLHVPDSHHRGRLTYLLAPNNNPSAQTAITFEGRTFDGSEGGRIQGKLEKVTVIPGKGGYYSFTVPYCSAALLEVALLDD